MSNLNRVITKRMCTACGRSVAVVASGRLRKHRGPHESRCAGFGGAPTASWVAVRLDFGAKVFSCRVPLELNPTQVAEVRDALRMISDAMDDAYGTHHTGKTDC